MTRLISISILLLMLLAASGCGTAESGDIRGRWAFRSGAEELFVFVFSGLPERGTVVDAAFPDGGAGIYAVAGEDVTFDFDSNRIGGRSCRFVGRFEGKDLVSGQMDIEAPYPPFAWRLQAEGRRQ